MRVIKLTLPFLLGAFLVVFGCQRKTKPLNPNLFPNTTLANIPVPYDTLFALVTLHWDGEDLDGYIKGYLYRYTTFHLFQGDSVVQDWIFTTETRKTIAFESTDSLNLQRFEVKAVDNEGAEDPTPAVLWFYTWKTYAPETEILSPHSGDTFFALEQRTDWWEGIQIIFHGWDVDGEILQYAWQIDGGEWVWTSDTSAILTPKDFGYPLAGEHLIRVKAQDNTGIETLNPDSIRIRLIIPTFDRRILILDETIEGGDTPGDPTDAEVDSFYNELFHPDANWDYQSRGVPPKDTLGRYQLLVWHADGKTEDHHILRYVDYLADYLNVGGKLWLSGWRILKSFYPDLDFPLEYEEDSFIRQYLHVLDANESPSVPGDFSGAKSSIGYPAVEVDHGKVGRFPYFGMLTNINILTPGAFTKSILAFQSDSKNPDFHGRTCAVRYYGTSYDVIFLAFPLFYIKKEDAKALVDYILVDLLD